MSDLVSSAMSQVFGGGSTQQGSAEQSVSNSPEYDVELEDSEIIFDEGDGPLFDTEESGESADSGSDDGDTQSDLSTKDSDEDETNVQAGSTTGKSKSKKQTSEDVERVTVSDDRGRREIEVDFSDREQLKKYVRLAHGSRKWQAERDRAQSSLAETQKKLQETKSNWDAVEAAYRDNGIQGLVDLIDGQGSHKKYEQGIIEKYERFRTATPAERRAMEAEESERKRAVEIERIRKENEDFRNQIAREKEEAELRATQSVVNPSFEKYRFAGKLGDPTDEHMFDEMLWNTALKRLEPYEEQGLEITRELVEREFSRASAAIRRRINVSAEKRVKQAISKKKEQATENAQKQVMSGYVSQSSKDAQEATDLIRSGDIAGLLRGFGKYGKLFGGK